MTDLAVTVNGLKFKNPFVIGSGPPGTNANVINKAFAEGWGGVVAKTISLEADKVTNVAPRYARMRAEGSKEVFGWENIELISDRPFETWLDEFKAIKDAHPEGILIASIMEEYRRDAWIEIVERCQNVGVDAFELNFSCPHGLPERKMGMAMGENPDIVAEVSGWAMEAATIPVWAKMTPNVTHIVDPGRAALAAGCHGLAAINTILSVMGVDLKTLRPMPTVEGYAVPGGYSCKAVRPIALRMVMELARMQTEDFPETTISGIGGIETGEDAAQFILLGAHTVQVCTGVMIHGYGMVKDMCEQLAAFMDQHEFASIDDFRGASLPYFSTHADLVRRQAEAKAAAKARREGMVEKDTEWEGDKFVEQSDRLVSND
ncbi:MAG: NAD-dependent dihydropyrimidine dehydrogenase subunit PreA [Phycisphaerales bacterium]|jgi:dihydropyrimidine dehydrogenase (NADP+)/dihydropyrimidine dehydrogenase (NAD+) subunit PreA|nr:NAD-dependent dihydropyrimidine dehydrogenase subunit PreA [Phycisphaerales bacterium]MDP7087885.1 NAD-dependent dihydropyrimidine dehydrogenase subunit PreA [Phycisphaerales bacterium]MDP7188849.1 NAD-dependent dihydropyrimidine dehydrogenase subunit PreA [Phycisphaerales bacterium]MDP7520343.1 NAD-dependent dihydropyrimidine dehydrogenase subunit PreA [Phycisphaerales bacterium]HCA38580.1 NAD-dependent dihydropyrimidine dehydrogenase subunit PreA [Phycisphaerales bacterium]